eukprot:6491886-Amphidinium_carterae.1
MIDQRGDGCQTLFEHPGVLGEEGVRALQAADGIECWDDQYIDDGVIECHSDDIDRTYANLEKALGPSGLRLNAGKQQAPHLYPSWRCRSR